MRHAALHHVGDGTMVWSKPRRHDGPKGVKMFVTNLTEASAGALRSVDAWRWGRELTMKALQSGVPLGQMPVTKEAERVTRSGTVAGLAYLLLVRLYGHAEALAKQGSLCKLKERFHEEVAQAAVRRPALRWQRKLKQCKDVA